MPAALSAKYVLVCSEQLDLLLRVYYREAFRDASSHVLRDLQVKDLEADKVESACSPSTAAMAGEVRDMINESSRTKSKKGGHGHVSCLLEMPAVRSLHRAI